MSAPPFPALPRPVRLFQWLRWRLLCNATRVMLRRTPVRLLSIVLCSLLIWGGLFGLGLAGFRFLDRNLNVPLDLSILRMLLSLLFFVLMFLLFFSTGIILYSSLFATAETDFLLSTPAPADQVFAFKYQGAVAFSSWAFILLGSPILLAYGLVHEGTPWYFYVLLPLFFVGFVLLPGSLGALACLVVVNLVPRRRKQVLILAGVLLLVGACWWVFGLVRAGRSAGIGSDDWVNQLLDQFTVIQGAFLPWQWMAEGLVLTASGDPTLFYYLALVWSNGLFLYLLTAWAAARLYRRGYNRAASGGTLRRRYGAAWLDRGLDGLLGWLPRQTRLLIIKDFRTFRRDPAQWAQILILLGLATLSFTAVGRFYRQDPTRTATQKSVISLLNLTATAFWLCAFTGRFVYPMLSLEGRKFWILGLLPLERDRLLWGKFAFSAIGCFGIAELVVVLSNVMLGMGWETTALQALTAAVLALGLSGLSVGLGAWMPNFQETDPSKLAVGFGGTLNLVAGLLFLILVLVLMALPWHLTLHFAEESPSVARDYPWLAAWLAAGIPAGLAVGALAVLVPLRNGIRALRRMEF